jgi:hypothetical protein
MAQGNTTEAVIADLIAQVRAIRTTPWSRQITATATGKGSGTSYTLDELATLAEQGGGGESGDPGPAGPPGAFSTVTVTMLAAGAEPTVTLGGEPGAQTLTLGIPAASAGPKAADPVYLAGAGVAPGATSTIQTWLTGRTIPDPGWPYRVWLNISGRIFVNSGTRARMVVRCGNGAADLSLPIITDAWGQSNDVLGVDFASPHRGTAVLTGASRIIGTVQRTDGSGAYDLQSCGLVYQVVPA